MDNKPGWKTTEFWFSVVSVATILLKLIGIDLSPEDRDALAIGLAGLVAGFLAVWGIVSRYIKSRSDIKVTRTSVEAIDTATRSSKGPLTINLGGN